MLQLNPEPFHLLPPQILFPPNLPIKIMPHLPPPPPSFYPSFLPPSSFPYTYYTSYPPPYIPTGLPVKPFSQILQYHDEKLDLPCKEEKLSCTKNLRTRRGPHRYQKYGAPKKLWLPKRISGEEPLSPSPREDLFLKLGPQATPPQGEVTLMIRNIPNKYSRRMLVDILDQHCFDMNQKLQDHPEHCRSKYDFLYLPIDFRYKGNLGYAFVNFTTKEAATRLYDAMHGQKWDSFRSRKICCICFARIQGKQQLKSNFISSRFPCDSEEYLPVEFDPPRDGCSSRSLPLTIGRRVGGLAVRAA